MSHHLNQPLPSNTFSKIVQVESLARLSDRMGYSQEALTKKIIMEKLPNLSPGQKLELDEKVENAEGDAIKLTTMIEEAGAQSAQTFLNSMD